MGARRLVVSALVVALVGAAGVARARVERQEGGPPWRATGRVGFTLDALVLPDTSGLVLEVPVRIPPATIEQLVRDDHGEARLHATVRVRGRALPRTLEASQDVVIAADDTLPGQGRVLVMRFAVPSGSCEVQARLEDPNSRRRGLLYSGRDQHEASELLGGITVPVPSGGRMLSDLQFLWPTPSSRVGLAFLRGGRAVVPDPERLYGLFADHLSFAFLARADGTGRPWHWIARVLDAQGDGIAQVESTAVAATWLDAEGRIDVSRQPSGLYTLQVEAWQEGDATRLTRRAPFSVAWQRDTWLRNAADLTDESHFLLDAEDEESFQRMAPGEQERFMEDFWRRRDPTPETAVNELYETFRERVRYANENFHHFGAEKGMFSDPGRTYIRYGPPTDILKQVIPTGDETLAQQLDEIEAKEDRATGDVRQKGLGGDMRPFEVWVYEGEIPLPIDADPRVRDRRPPRRRMVFLFVDQQGNGNYTLRYSTE